jgi:hypothetical protein
MKQLQNKFHNFWIFTLAYKNYRSCISYLKEIILNHTKTINFSSFIIFLDTHHHEEAAQKIS